MIGEKRRISMKILVSGSRGFIGSTLIPFLTSQGHDVVRLVRSSSTSNAKDVSWNPETSIIDKAGLEGIDAIIHLAGEPIAKGRWTAEKKAKIRDSRVKGTGLLAKTVLQLNHPPKIAVCASAIGIYGNQADEILTEESVPGTGFLAEVGQQWESAANPMKQRGIRLVYARTGIVLAPSGGALALMLPIFKMGLGGNLGSGKQFMSWISLEDEIGAFHHALVTNSLEGPVNFTAPRPVTNTEFTKTLGRALHRPTIFPLPAFAARIMFGELADEALLASARVEPTKLLSSGYKFRHPDLETALQSMLG